MPARGSLARAAKNDAQNNTFDLSGMWRTEERPLLGRMMEHQPNNFSTIVHPNNPSNGRKWADPWGDHGAPRMLLERNNTLSYNNVEHFLDKLAMPWQGVKVIKTISMGRPGAATSLNATSQLTMWVDISSISVRNTRSIHGIIKVRGHLL